MIRYFRVSTLLLILFSLASSLSAQEKLPSSLKVLTYNIWNGFDWGKDQAREEKFVEWVKAQNADVIALQELCGFDEQKLKEIAAKWGHPYVQILKEKGYPTGLTSKKPIELVERTQEGFWHGLLHAKTFGIDFFVVHLSPSDVEFRHREAQEIKSRIKSLGHDRFMILGDFNAFSPFDAQVMEDNASLKAGFLASKDEKYSNLRLGEFDYSVLSEFFSIPAVDVSWKYVKSGDNFTFPTPGLIGHYGATAESLVRDRERLDYILTGPTLAKSCTKVSIFNQGPTEGLSDHFPIMAEFRFDSK